MPWYGLDDYSSDEESAENSACASPLAGRRAPIPVKRVSFADSTPDVSTFAILTKDTRDASAESSDSEQSDASTKDTQRLQPDRSRGFSVDDAYDSEEEAWPVDPVKSKNYLDKIDILMSDHWSIAQETEEPREWSAVSLSFSRNIKELHAKEAEAIEGARRRRAADLLAEEAEVADLIQSLELEHDEVAEKAARDFEDRNRQLWEAINATIAATEALAAQQAAQHEAARIAKGQADKAANEAKREATRKAEERIAKENAETDRKSKAAEAAELARAKAEADAKAQADWAGGPGRDWQKWTAKMTTIKETVLPVVSQDPRLSKECSAARRKITPRIGQLVNTAESVSTVTAIIAQVLEGLRNVAPVAYTWGLNHLVKALIRQAETEVTAKQSVAFPLGRVVASLFLRGHAELGDVFMARLVKKCFWIAAWYPRRTEVREGTSEVSHRKLLGHIASEDTVQYSNRMCGILALYAAVLQTSPVESPQAPTNQSDNDAVAAIPVHFQPNAGWTWLVQILQPPLVASEPVPNLIQTFLAVAGAGLHEVFGRQFVKFLVCLLREGIKDRRAGFSPASKASQVKLELLLDDWIEARRIPMPQGRALDAPSNFAVQS